MMLAHGVVALSPGTLLGSVSTRSASPRLRVRPKMVEVVADQEACVQRMWQGGGLTEGKVVPTTVSSWYDSGIRLAPLSDVESEYDDDAAQTEAAQSDRATRNAVEPAAPTATAMATGAEAYVPMSMESLREAEGRESGIFALALVVGYLVLGVGVYSTATDWSVLQSLYYVVVTLTSVGYGDLTVDTDAMRLFTCGYILIGVGVLGTALGEVISSLLNTDSTPAGGRRQPPDFALCPGPKVPLHTFT